MWNYSIRREVDLKCSVYSSLWMCMCEGVCVSLQRPMCLGEVLSSKKYLLITKDDFKKPSILSLLFSNIVERYLKTVLKKKLVSSLICFPHAVSCPHLSLLNFPRNSSENTLFPGPLLHTYLQFLLPSPPPPPNFLSVQLHKGLN